MSIEKQIETLVAALNANTAALTGEKPARVEKEDARDEDDPDADAPARSSEKPARGRPAKDKGDKADKADAPEKEISDEGVKKRFGDFLTYGTEGDEEDDEVREKRKALVMQILDLFGAEKGRDMTQAQRVLCFKWIKESESGKRPVLEIPGKTKAKPSRDNLA